MPSPTRRMGSTGDPPVPVGRPARRNAVRHRTERNGIRTALPVRPAGRGQVLVGARARRTAAEAAALPIHSDCMVTPKPDPCSKQDPDPLPFRKGEGTFGGTVSESPNRDPRTMRFRSPLPARSGERIKVRGFSDCILTATKRGHGILPAS